MTFLNPFKQAWLHIFLIVHGISDQQKPISPRLTTLAFSLKMRQFSFINQHNIYSAYIHIHQRGSTLPLPGAESNTQHQSRDSTTRGHEIFILRFLPCILLPLSRVLGRDTSDVIHSGVRLSQISRYHKALTALLSL
ncbi:hypothetical protein WA026_013266, partial [Henosepilachna vigintioctopunctata]